MHVAIVGLSELTEKEEHEVENEVRAILKKYDPISTTIIYGGAKGVDTIASNTALLLRFAIKPYLPFINTWVGYKKRNIEMAKDCDELYCITVPTRTKTQKFIRADSKKCGNCLQVIKAWPSKYGAIT